MNNKIDFFNENAPIIFQKLVDDYGYILTEIKTSEINENKWSTKLIYLNYDKKLKIEIEQAPYYSDYGFTFFIYNLENNEYKIIYNIPHEKQDNAGDFLTMAYSYIFTNEIYLKIINGQTWKI